MRLELDGSRASCNGAGGGTVYLEGKGRCPSSQRVLRAPMLGSRRRPRLNARRRSGGACGGPG